MASKKFNEISKNIEGLEVSLQKLNIELDKAAREGKSLDEILKLFGKDYELLAKAILSAEAAVLSYNKANAGNAKTNEQLRSGMEALLSGVERLISGEKKLATTITSAINPALDQQKAIVGNLDAANRKANETEVEWLNRLRKLNEQRIKDLEAERAAQEALHKEKLDAAKDEVRAAIKQVDIDAKRAAETKKAAESNRFFGESFRKAFSPQAIGNAIASITKFIGIYQIYYALLNAVKDITFGSIKVFIDFQETLGRLGAVSGATAGELKLMEGAIRSVAVETKFTADEMASLAVSLAKLGVQASDIPKFLGPIALAAQATGESLDKVGETIIKVNNQFGLSASESSQTAATLVSAINDSALSLDTFNTAVQYVGPIADQVGLTFEQTSGYMKELADNGFTASRIGTGLRSIFIELKRSGEPLNETLKKLAKENISVAEATDLVGKRAAAQLLSILRNIDAVEKQTSVEESLATTLRASAAEMSTVSGQLKLLKSAYNELQISIGESITSSEIFLDLVGLLSDDTERLARGYRILNSVTTEASDTFTNELGKAVSGTSNAFNVLKKSVEAIDDKRLTALLDRVERKGVTDNMKALVAELEKMSEPDFFDNLIQKASTLEDLGDEAKGLIGALLQIQRTIDQEMMATEVRVARQGILDTYQPEIDAIEKIANLKQRDLKYVEEQDKLQTKLEETRKKLEDERFKSIEERDDAVIRQLEGEISGYQRLISTIADLSEGVDDEIKKRQEAAKAQFKLDSDEIKRKEAQIKDELKRIKSIRDARIREAEERARLERAAAQTVEERAQAEIRLNNSIAAANDDAKEMTDGLILGINELANESADLATKYTDGEFASGIEQLSNSVNGLFEDFAALQGAIEVTFTEKSLDLVNDAKSVIGEYGEELDKLTEKYGDNAEANADYINEANLLTDVTIENLKNLLKAVDLTSEEGHLLKKIIEEQIAALDAARPKFKEFGKLTAEEIGKAVVDGIKTITEAMDKFNDVILENQKNRLDREIDQIENRYKIEEDILKSQLQNQLITEEEYRSRSTELKRKQLGEENTIEKAIFDSEQKRDRQNALTDYLEAIASIIPELIKGGTVEPASLTAKSAIAASLATLAYGSELAAIGQRKFFPKKFAEGGFVYGPSHADGGVPFSVSGQGGYEMEGGEFIVNKRAAQLHRNVLERINSSVKPSPISGRYAYGNDMAIRKFAQGGIVDSPQYVQQTTEEQLEYLRAIAAATTSTAVGVSKPVRAYVTSTDLNSNDTERKIKERNTRI